MTKRRRAEGRAERRRAPIAKKPPPSANEGQIQRNFPLILAAAMTIIAATGTGACLLAIESGSLVEFQKSLTTIMHMGAGAVFTLLGSRK